MPLFNPAGTVNGNLSVTGNATVTGTLGVTGYTTLAGAQTNSDFASLGNISISSVGSGLKVKEGSNARMGTAVLVAGTVTVSNTTVSASTRVQLTRSTTGGTVGHLSYTINAGVSFTINSSSATDTSTVNWLLVEPA